MEKMKYIATKINEPFEVNLQSMLGSTNYSWGITKMPDSVFLLYTEVTPALHNPFGPVNQKFVFAFNGMVDTNMATIEFSLLCLATPSMITPETRTIKIDVKVCGDEIDNDTIKYEGAKAYIS